MRGIVTMVTTMNASEIGRESVFGMICHHVLCPLAAHLLAERRLAGGHLLVHGLELVLWLVRDPRLHHALLHRLPQGSKHIACPPDETWTPQTFLQDTTEKEGTVSLHAAAAAVGAGVAAEIGEDWTGMTVITGKADAAGLREKGTNIGTRVTTLSHPLHIGRLRLL